MKKFITAALAAAMVIGCVSGAMADKTGLGVVTDIASSTSAAEGKAGKASVNSTICAVTLDDEGKIVSISFDVAQTAVAFDEKGEVTTDLTADVLSKRELKEGYGMKPASPIGKEWYEQMDSLEAWCIGKTVEEVLGMPTYDKGDGHHDCVPDDVDLKTSCTVSIGDNLKALAKAAENAK